VHAGLRRASGTSATILHGPTPTFDDSGWEHLDGGRSWGHQTHPKDAYSRRFVEITLRNPDSSQRVERFQHDFPGWINLELNPAAKLLWMESPRWYPRLWRAMGAFAAVHPRYRPFVMNRFTHDSCDCQDGSSFVAVPVLKR
jgi:hypothetical protein